MEKLLKNYNRDSSFSSDEDSNVPKKSKFLSDSEDEEDKEVLSVQESPEEKL